MSVSIGRRPSRGWTLVRWPVLGGIVVAAWACTQHSIAAPTPDVVESDKHQFLQAVNHKLDLLFMIDNSSSMSSLQDRLSKNLPVLVQGLATLPTGLPDIHIAVVSSSSQPGMTTDIGGCKSADVQNGVFQHTFNPTSIPGHPECDGLTLNGTFISAEAGAAPNFTGKIEDVFGCIALLGQNGCGFEHQFGSIERALDPAQPIAANAGFLRDDAYLGVVLLTNEDDCSAPATTSLFDDGLGTSADPLGRLASYRCTEFGILCGGKRPPHTLPAATTEQETGCVSAEDQGQLITDASFEAFLLGLKHGDRSKLLVAAIVAPPTPFAVSTTLSQSSKTDPSDPTAPGLVPSCYATNMIDYGDPAVRVTDVVKSFGGVTFNVCADDYSPAMSQIATKIGQFLGPQCLPDTILNDASGNPECTVTQTTAATGGTSTDTVIPYCGTATAPFPSPCWRLLDSSTECVAQKLLDVCRDSACDATTSGAATSSNVTVECAVAP
ncbi:MAG TPA: hypothetical protein VH560_10400 [Polyangia bacterium]|jgi:hypothetical protein|nr:hypothetical protein [Polyangia bacterium]